MSKTATTIFFLAIAFLGMITVITIAQSLKLPSVLPTYDLIAEFHGNRFVLDHDLSLTDCLDAAPRHDPAHKFYTACELSK